MKGSDKMHTEISALTQAQSGVLSTVVRPLAPEFVVSTDGKSAVLNGSITESLATLQAIMDNLRENGEGRTSSYRVIAAVRNKLDDAKDQAKPKDVRVIPNGVNVSGDVPAVLSGAPVLPKVEAAKPARGRPRKAVGATPRPTESVPATGHTEPANDKPANGRAVLKLRLTADMRSNFHDLARMANTEEAREYWARKLESLPTA